MILLLSLQEITEPTGAVKDQDPACKGSLVVDNLTLIMDSLPAGDDESESLLSDYRVVVQTLWTRTVRSGNSKDYKALSAGLSPRFLIRYIMSWTADYALWLLNAVYN